MKITKATLRRLIAEEIENVKNESTEENVDEMRMGPKFGGAPERRQPAVSRRSAAAEASKLQRQLQDRVSTTGEFNYRFESDDVRDRALDAVVRHFAQSGATSVTATPDGIDLEGTVLSSGIEHSDAGIDLQAGWFSGYVRVATNEKSGVRSYFSADRPEDLHRIESEARHLLADKFNGRVID